MEDRGERYNRLMHICVAISWLVAAFGICLYIYGQFVDKHDVLNIGSFNKLETTWEYETTDGRTGTCVFPYRLKIPVGEAAEFKSVLPEDISDGMYMVVSAGRDVKIYIDNEERFIHNQSDSKIPGRIVKSGFFPIELSAGDAGKSIRIVKDEESEYNGNLMTIYYGDLYAVIRHLWGEYAFRFFAALLLLFITIIVCVGDVIIRIIYKVADKKLRMLNYGMLAIAVWIITDSYMYQLVFGNIYVDGVISYILTPLMPLSFLRYINELQEKRHEKLYSMTIAALVLDELVMCTLHFTGILSFDRTLEVNNSIVVLSALVTFGVLVWEAFKGYTESYKWVAIGACGLIAGAILEVVCINLHFIAFGDFWLTLGIYFMFASALIHTVNDILIREKERRKAIEASMVKTNFLANMSHEIRTPINAIMGMNEMILRESESPEVIEYAEHIDRSGKLLLSIIGDVLDISKIESGKLNIVSDPYKLSSLISDAYELMNQLAADKSLEVRFEVDSELPSVLDGDANHIKQIVINLITNAVKYTRTGFIGLKAYATKYSNDSDAVNAYETCMLHVEISDSGIGIKREDLTKLFETFERVDHKMNRNIQGTGLGLSIVKSLTEAMGGTVDVKSKYGKGSTFAIAIPQRVISSNPIGEEWKDAAPSGASASDNHKYKVSFTAPEAEILAVDDNSSNLMIIKQFLKPTKVRVDLVGSGQQALELTQEKKYDVILLDHMMPEPDGIEVLKAIRSSADNPNRETPVIVLTANATQDSRNNYIKAGFDDYISKPVDGHTLESTLMNYLPKDKLVTEDHVSEKHSTDTDTLKSESLVTADEQNVGKEASLMSGTASTKENDYNGLFEREEFAQVVKVFGNKEFAFEIIRKVAEDSLKNLDALKEDMDKEDYKDYAIKAHGIKGMMASVYYEPLRARSKEHEMAAKEGRYDFIKEDYEEYSKQCRQFCRSVLGQE